MAKKPKIKKDEIDNDYDFDNGLDSGDMDFGMEPPKDDRKPITKLTTGMITGASEGLRDTAFLKQTLKATLPKGYGDSVDLADKVGDNVRGLYDDSVKEMKPAIKDFKRIVGKLVPKDSAFVPKRVQDMISGWEQEAKEEREGKNNSTKETQREDFLNIQLTEAFKEQFIQGAQERSEDVAQDRLKQGLEMTRHRDIFGVANQSNLHLSRLDNYQSNITLKYQKKSLEIGYRQLFAMQDILEETKKSFALQTTSFETIAKNTALPDFVKIQTSEFRNQVFKNKFYEKISNGLFGDKDSYLEKIFSNTRKKVLGAVKNTVDTVRTTIGGVDQANDAINGMGDMGGDKHTMVGEMLGGSGAQAGAGWLINKFLKPLIEKNPNILKWAGKAGRFSNNIDREIEDFRTDKSYEEDVSGEQSIFKQFFNFLARNAQGFLPGNTVDTRFDVMTSKNMNDPYVITKKTDKSLNEIIPGYLAKILREVTVIRSGTKDVDNSISELKFDYTKNTFVTARNRMLNVKNELFKTERFQHTEDSVKELIQNTNPNMKDVHKKELEKALIGRKDKEPLTENNIEAFLNQVEVSSGNVKIDRNVRARLSKEILSKAKTLGDKIEDLDKLLKLIGGDALPPKEQMALKYALVKNSTSTHSLNKINMIDQMGYPEDTGKLIKPVLGKFFEKKGDDQVEAQELHNSLSRNMSDLRAIMQEKLGLGQDDDLKKIGLMKVEGENRSFDIEKFLRVMIGEIKVSDLGAPKPDSATLPTPTSHELMLSPALSLTGSSKPPTPESTWDEESQTWTVPSDIHVKKDFKPIKSKSSLDAIKRTGVHAWNYITGKGDGGSHIGPMAQTVNKTMGEDAAPGGTEIDLVTMNGVTMSAIQELDKKQEKLQNTIDQNKEPAELTNPYFGPAKPITLDEQLVNIVSLLSDIRDNSTSGVNLGLGNFPKIDFSKFKLEDLNTESFKKWFLDKVANNKDEADEDNKGEDVDTGEVDEEGHPVFKKNIPGYLAKAMYHTTDKIGKGLKYAKDKTVEGAGWAKEGVTGQFNKTKDWYLGDIYDVYVEGDEKDRPRLFAEKIKQGFYLDVDTKKNITHQDDITGDVKEIESGNTVIKKEELELMYTKNPRERTKRFFKSVGKGINTGFSATKDFVVKYTPDVIKYTKELVERLGTGIKSLGNQAYAIIDHPIDIYVKGDKLPTLLAMVMEAGGYFSCLTKKVIIRPGQIDGPVMDHEGKTVLSVDQIRLGLVDIEQNPVKTPLDKLKNTLAAIGMATKNGAAWAWDKAKSFSKDFSGKFKGFFSDFSIEINGKKSLTVLEEIRDLLVDKIGGEGYERKTLPSLISKPLKEKITQDDEEAKEKARLKKEQDDIDAETAKDEAEIARGSDPVLSPEEIKQQTNQSLIESRSNSTLEAYEEAKEKARLKKEQDDIDAETAKDEAEIARQQEDPELKKPEDKPASGLGDTSLNNIKDKVVSTATDIKQKLIDAKIGDVTINDVLDKANSALASGKEKATEVINSAKLLLKDLYVSNEVEPRILEAKLRLGHYVDVLTNKVITNVNEIKNGIKDKTTGKEVVSAEEVLKLTYENLQTKAREKLDSLKQTEMYKNAVAKINEAMNTETGIRISTALKDGISAVKDAKDKVMDVYDDVSSRPILYASKFEQGLYRDKITNKVLKLAEDITGEVIDERNNTVVTLEQLDKLRVFNVESKRFAKLRFLGRGLLSIAKPLWYFQTVIAPKMVAWNFKMIGKGLKLAGKTAKWLFSEKVRDVYVGDEEKPRLYATKLQLGHYVDWKSKKPIFHQNDIKGEVRDEHNEIKISEEDLDNLVVFNSILRVPFRVIGWVGKKIGQGIGLVGGYVQKKGIQATKWAFKQIGNTIKKVTGGLIDWLSKPGDVYVASRPKNAALIGELMKEGAYINTESQKIVYTIGDIDGEVKENKENGQVKITLDEVKAGLIDGMGRPIKPTIFQRIGGVLGKINRFFSYRSKLKGKWSNGIKPLEGVADTVTRGADDAAHAVADTYREAKAKIDEKKITIATKTNEILEEIKVVLGGKPAESVIDKEVAKQEEINKSKAEQEIADKKAEDDWFKSHPENQEPKLKSPEEKPSALDGKKIEPVTTTEVMATETATNTEEMNESVGKILTLVENKLSPKKVIGDSDGDGDRDGSVKDLMQNRKPKDDGKTKPGENTPLLGGMFGKFKGMFGKQVEVAEDSRDYLKDVRNLLVKIAVSGSLGGGGGPDLPDGPDGKGKKKVGKLARYGGNALKFGGGALGVAGGAYAAYNAYENIKEGNYLDAAGDVAIGAGSVVAGSALWGAGAGALAGTGALAGGAAGAAGALGSMATVAGALSSGLIAVAPALAVAGAVGLAGYGLYKGYKYLTRGNMTPLEKIRYVQYGFNKDEPENASKILELENFFKEHTKVSEGNSRIDETKLDTKEMLSIFGLDDKSKDDLELFLNWYQNRFKPVYLKHVNALYAIDKKSDLTAANDLNDVKKKAYIEAIRYPDGPYDYKSLPMKDLGSGYKVSNGSDVAAVIDEVIKELKLDKLKDDKSKSVVGEATASASATIDPETGKVKVVSYLNADGTVKKFTDVKTVGSTVTKEMLTGNDKALALAAVRYRSYGLVDLDPDKVRALIQLEAEVSKMVKYNDKDASWTGSIVDVFERVTGLFGAGEVFSAGFNAWKKWFNSRFLPVYLNYLIGYKIFTGKEEDGKGPDAIKPSDQVNLAKQLAGTSGIWSVTSSPWPEYKLNTNSDSVKENIAFLESVAAQNKLAEEKKAIEDKQKPPAVPDPKLKTDTTEKSALPKAPTTTDSKTDSDGKPVVSTVAGNSPSDVQSGGNVALAAGPLVSGSGGMNAINVQKGVSLDRVNPELLKLFYGMVEEYNTLTGKKVTVTDGFRTYAEQKAIKAKKTAQGKPNEAAEPGSSMHEFGLAIDADHVSLDAMDKLGLMKKYGFTRPVGGENWHMESAGIQNNPSSFKGRPSEAGKVILASPGRGGGGYGTVSGALKYKRNPEMAKSLLYSSKTVPIENKPVDPALPPAPLERVKKSDNKPNPTVDKTPKYDTAKNGENKPADTTTSNSDLNKQENTMPADPSVKVESPTGTSVEEMKTLIEASAKSVGIDPKLATAVAAVESDFKPNAGNGSSSAKGLFQFIDDTWKEQISKYGSKYGLPPNSSVFDPKANALMGAQYIKTNVESLKQTTDTVGPVEAYMAHFLGLGGAKEFLGAMKSSPETIGSELMPKAASKNTETFTSKGKALTLKEIYEVIYKKLKEKAKTYGINIPEMSTGAGGGRGSVNPDLVTPDAGAPENAGRGNVNPANVTPAADETVVGNAGRGSINPDNVTPIEEAPSYVGNAGRGNINPNAVSESFAEMARSPMQDTYGVNPEIIANNVQPDQNGITANLFKTTEGLLSQSLDVEKQMLDVLKNIFGIISKKPDEKQVESKPNFTPPQTRPQGKTFQAPNVPVPMRKTIV